MGAKPTFCRYYSLQCMCSSRTQPLLRFFRIHTYIPDSTTDPDLHGASVRLGSPFVDQHTLVDIRQVTVELSQNIEVLLEVCRKHLLSGSRRTRSGGMCVCVCVCVCVFVFRSRCR